MAGVDSDDNYEDLMCDNKCGRYLSFSPVFMKENGSCICADCNRGEEHRTTRNKYYEAVAKRLNFPCRFKSSGCNEIHLWEETKHHEEECIYRHYNCFVNDCTWIGSLLNMKQHYEEKHPQFVLNLPAKVQQPNITLTNDVKYLASVLNNLFVIHVKYVTSSSTLSYYTCFLGKEELATYFDYVLEITSDRGNLNMKNSVQPINELYSPKNVNVIELNVNSLLSTGLITKYEDCTFNLAIKLKNNKCSGCKLELGSVNIFERNCYCNSCFAINKCNPNILSENPESCTSCSYRDIAMNLLKHNNWFCVKLHDCIYCRHGVSSSKFNHLVEVHIPRNMILNTNKHIFKQMNVNTDLKAALIAYDSIFLIKFNFECTVLSETFECTIISDLPTSLVYNFKCSFKLSNPNCSSGLIDMTTDLSNNEYEWRGTVVNNKLNSYLWKYYESRVFKRLYDIEINIEKKPVGTS